MKKLIGITLAIAALAFTGVAQAETIEDKATNIAVCPDLVELGQNLQQLARGGSDVDRLKHFYHKEDDLSGAAKRVLDLWVHRASFEGTVNKRLGAGTYPIPSYTDMLMDCYLGMIKYYGWE